MKVPAQQEREVVTLVITPALTLRLYSNDKAPAAGDVTADYTETVGGGYVNKALTFANWTQSTVAISPQSATYAPQTWLFTGVTGAPGTVYGYYVTRNSDGKLMWAERFPAGSLPFNPINGSKVVVLPKYQAQSLF